MTSIFSKFDHPKSCMDPGALSLWFHHFAGARKTGAGRSPITGRRESNNHCRLTMWCSRGWIEYCQIKQMIDHHLENFGLRAHYSCTPHSLHTHKYWKLHDIYWKFRFILQLIHSIVIVWGGFVMVANSFVNPKYDNYFVLGANYLGKT